METKEKQCCGNCWWHKDLITPRTVRCEWRIKNKLSLPGWMMRGGLGEQTVIKLATDGAGCLCHAFSDPHATAIEVATKKGDAPKGAKPGPWRWATRNKPLGRYGGYKVNIWGEEPTLREGFTGRAPDSRRVFDGVLLTDSGEHEMWAEDFYREHRTKSPRPGHCIKFRQTTEVEEVEL